VNIEVKLENTVVKRENNLVMLASKWEMLESM
jgi:hypothetical protein